MDADFLIIGGGIAGVSAAARLSALGRVILLESEDNFGHHASGRSAALYEPYYGLDSVAICLYCITLYGRTHRQEEGQQAVLLRRR